VRAFHTRVLPEPQTFFSSEHLLEAGRRDGKGGLSALTVLHHHRVLRCALGHAVKWQLVTRNVAEAVTPPRPVRRELAVLDREGTRQLLQAAEGTRLYLPVLLAVTTGLRLGEILGLRWQDVNLAEGVLAVRQALQQTREGDRFKTPKTHRSNRSVALPAAVVEFLREWKEEQSRICEFVGPPYQDLDLVCCQELGTPWKTKVISKAFEHLAARTGCPDVRFHDLRHRTRFGCWEKPSR
jgi:integrase